MAVRYLMDQHVRRAVTEGLRARGVDVVTAFEDGSHELPDPELLDRATHLQRVLFSQDDDLLAEARHRQLEGIHFAGVVYGHQLKVSIGTCIRDLEVNYAYLDAAKKDRSEYFLVDVVSLDRLDAFFTALDSDAEAMKPFM